MPTGMIHVQAVTGEVLPVEGVTVREAVERFVRGELPFAEASNK